MKRVLGMFGAALLFAAGATARAEPTESGKKAKESATKDDGAQKEKAGGEAKPAAGPPDWLRAGRGGKPSPASAPGAAAARSDSAPVPLDLFGRGRFTLPEGGKDEKRSQVSLGDDSSWKVQAAQVGVMAGAFAALTALCAGGGCMLPKAVSSWLPGPFKAKPYKAPQVAPTTEYRKAR